MKQLNEILRERRDDSGYSLESIAKETKIKKEFLQAIEAGEYSALPSDSHAAGFVKNYAQYLGLPEAKIMALFRRDYKMNKPDVVPGFRKKTYTRTKSIFFTLKGGIFLLAGIVIIAYLAFQFASLFLGPKLQISSPKEGQVVSSSVVNVKGKTDPYATLLVNGEETYVALDGTFTKSLYVFTGKQTVTVTAKNRFGKHTVETVRMVVK